MSATESSAAPAWLNWAKNQEVRPKNLVRPQSLADLVQVVREVTRRRGRLRAVATGLSFSDILQTDDTLVVVTSLARSAPSSVLLPLEDELWHDRTPVEPRVRIPCSGRIRALNAALASAGLGFSNLGGYDGQTLIGAISTSTHGSGITLPPFPDLVRSLDLIATGGRRYRIEPARGITDPDAFRRRYGARMTLVQNDQWFHSAVVSLGCLGIITAVTLAVSPAYRLIEHRRVDSWSRVRRELEGGKVLRTVRHYEVLINPFPRRDGDHTCLVTERRLARPGTPRRPLPASRRIAEDVLFLSTSQEGLLRVFNGEPRLVPTILEASLTALATGSRPHVEESYRIFNLGKINTADVLSAEYFYPIRDDLFLRGVDRLLAVVRDNRRRGLYQTSPLALRFMKGSRAYLSMAYGEDTCSVETPIFSGSVGAPEMLLTYEQSCYEASGRPHWGQINELTGTPGWFRRAYPRADRFLEVYRTLNAEGVFDNHFTDRLGISVGSPS